MLIPIEDLKQNYNKLDSNKSNLAKQSSMFSLFKQDKIDLNKDISCFNEAIIELYLLGLYSYRNKHHDHQSHFVPTKYQNLINPQKKTLLTKPKILETSDQKETKLELLKPSNQKGISSIKLEIDLTSLVVKNTAKKSLTEIKLIENLKKYN